MILWFLLSRFRRYGASPGAIPAAVHGALSAKRGAAAGKSVNAEFCPVFACADVIVPFFAR